jgi:hypothetical protein
MAPSLYNIARYKSRSISIELKNHNWIRGPKNIDSESQIEEFILLFMAIASVQLTNQKDKILWNWTPDGIYMVSSAYEVQFRGAICHFPSKNNLESQSRTESQVLWVAGTS